MAQKLSTELPCTSGKGDTKPQQLACTYLTQDVHGQVHQPKNVALVPWVQHANVVGDVVGAALHPSQGGILKPDTQGSHQGTPRLLNPCLGLVEKTPMLPSARLPVSSHNTLRAKQSAGGTVNPMVSRTPTACAEARSCRSPRDGEGCISGVDGAKQLLFTGT